MERRSRSGAASFQYMNINARLLSREVKIRSSHDTDCDREPTRSGNRRDSTPVSSHFLSCNPWYDTCFYWYCKRKGLEEKQKIKEPESKIEEVRTKGR